MHNLYNKWGILFSQSKIDIKIVSVQIKKLQYDYSREKKMIERKKPCQTKSCLSLGMEHPSLVLGGGGCVRTECKNINKRYFYIYKDFTWIEDSALALKKNHMYF